MKNVWILVLVGFLMWNCTSEPKYDDYDLVKHGLSLKIKAPMDPEVTVVDMGIAKDVTVQKGTDFSIQILSSTATNYNVAELIAEKRKEVEASAFFSEIIQEDDNGFVFEKKVDEENISYDFRLIRIIGDTEYDFQTGLIGKFSKEDVLDMYEAVK